MRFLFPRLEYLADDLNNAIANILDEHPEFDKIDISMIHDFPPLYGFLNLDFYNDETNDSLNDFFIEEAVYFPFSLN